MAIVSREITELSKHKGFFRARYAYTLSDGRVVTRGPTRVESEAEAIAIMNAIEPSVLSRQQTIDANKAVSLDLTGAYGEASAEQVDAAYAEKLAEYQEQKTLIDAEVTRLDSKVVKG